jgi:hypothetical protein
MSERPPLPPLRDSGLPTLPSGEPVLHRWFVIAMLILVPIALAVSVWAAVMVFGGSEPIPPAERRPPGDATTTVDRGDAELGTIEDTIAGPSCATAIRVVGDPGAQGQAGRALGATCALLQRDGLEDARAGLDAWITNRGQLRYAVFERSGVESSMRTDGGRLVLELNASFQFEDATRAAPAIVHQLTLLADPGWPGAPVTAERALRGAEAEALACDRLVFTADPPRGCLDVEELLASEDPLGQLLAAGYPPVDG